MYQQDLISHDKWQQIESEAYDNRYINSFPFDFMDDHIITDHVLFYEDYCYLKGRRADGGHTMKRIFEKLDLSNIKDKKILDVGCGIGQYSVFFAMLGAEAFGIDISKIAIQTAQRIAKANNVEQICHFSVQNLTNTNFPDDFFDIVIFYDSFHHVIKYPNIREETWRILKNGGTVIIGDGITGNRVFQFARSFTMRKNVIILYR